MKLLSIEPTPSPNTMKLNVDESLPNGIMRTYSHNSSEPAPAFIQQLLNISGVKSIFQAADFIAIDRVPKGDWKQILTSVHEVFGEADNTTGSDADSAMPAKDWGEVTVLLQTFRGIPLQVRARAGTDEARAAMPQRFADAVSRAAASSLLRERRLEELGVRYGELQEVLDVVVAELDASYTDERLEALVQAAAAAGEAAEPAAAAAGTAAPASVRPGVAGLTDEEIAAALRDSDWKRRYAALQQVQPSLETLHLLVLALRDEHSSVRRLATVYLGDIGEPEVLPYLYQALEDRVPAVRRTAGDTLSDIGNPAAIPAMIKALRDDNKLVRWRAARFLYEVGDHTALDALREAADDPEFEISMQINMAIMRIESGQEAEGTVWQQMTRRNQ